MQNIQQVKTSPNGRGVDADPKNDPTYPIRHRISAEEAHSGWERPVEQRTDVEVLQSNEYLARPAVFGTSTPPAGVSGMIRRAAFKYSESSYLHWLPLVLADRINVVEGIVGDLMHARIPNAFAEAGGKAQWRYNRRHLVDQTLIRLAVATVAIAFVRPWLKGKRGGSPAEGTGGR